MRKNVATSKMYILRKWARKLKNMIFLHFLITFYKFALKIETGVVKRVAKPILKNRKCQ